MSSVAVHRYARGDTAVKIAASLERAIRAGRIEAGTRLPPVRALAAEIGRSPTTIALAYANLRQRGLTTAGGRRGTFVTPRPRFTRRPQPAVPEHARDLASGNPDRTLLPDLAPALAHAAGPPRLYGENLNHPPLVEAAGEMFARDGIDARHLGVTAGAMDGLERVLRMHLAPGDQVAVEDPGYFAVFDLLAGIGLSPVPVGVDEHGLDPRALSAALENGARAIVVTPRAQNPTGAALDDRRTTALRGLLRGFPGVLLVEDDHGGPISGSAAHTLTTGSERWAIIRSVAKALGPDLRLAFLTGDELTVCRVEEQQTLGARWVSHILQRTVAELFARKTTARRLEKAERTYEARRADLIDELAGRGIEATGASGLNVWIPVPEEGELVAGLLERGWAVAAGERFRLLSPPAIRVTVSTLTRKEARGLASDLEGLLAPGVLTATA